ncbi:MAG: hypothetical protein ACNA8W_08190 [Bradymonadaceae bacterium]
MSNRRTYHDHKVSNGGVCLPICQDPRDCRTEYHCSDQHLRNRTGTSPVCINVGWSGYDVVGTACSRHSDCPGGHCLTGSRYPGGTCTYACDSNHDCPSYASCIDRDGGVCLPNCDHRHDCRSGYRCSSQSNHGHSGRSDVCIDA